MVAATNYIGRGVYSVADAARLLGRHYNTIHRWLSPDEGIIVRSYDLESHAISFVELMELHFIDMFESQGVSFQTIRRAAQIASKRFRTDYPFTVKQFDTDGHTIFATLADEANASRRKKVLVEDLRIGQYVFGNIVKPFFRKLDYRKSDVSRYWPMFKKGRVVLDPARNLGQPIDDKTGIPTKALFDALQAGGGQSVKEVARWFDAPESAVTSAMQFEKSLNPK
jgi:hypothetical protein